MYTRKSARNTGKPQRTWSSVNQPGCPRGTGRAPWGGGEVRSTAEAGQRRWREGASVSRQTHDVVRDLEIGQPINSAECSETADGVYTRKRRQKPGIASTPLYDKISREDILAHAYAQCRSNKGAPGVDGQDFADIEAYGVQRWLGETGACAQAGDLSTGSHQKSVHPEGQRQTPAAGHLDLAGSGLHDGSDAGAGPDL